LHVTQKICAATVGTMIVHLDRVCMWKASKGSYKQFENRMDCK
jgi:hypothetical protein